MRNPRIVVCLRSCRAVHTLFGPLPTALVFIDSSGRAVAFVTSLTRRFYFAPGAQSALEFFVPPERLPRVRLGDRFSW